MSFSDNPLSFAGSNGRGFGWCCPRNARAACGTAAAVACPCAAAAPCSAAPAVSTPARFRSASPAPPATTLVMASRLETCFMPLLLITRVPPLGGRGEDYGSDDANDADDDGGDKRRLGHELPQQPAAR